MKNFNGPRLSAALAFLVSMLPFCYLAWLTAVSPVEVPYWDEWRMVPVIHKAFEGTLGMSDLWAQSNEHRIFFPRIILVALALLTRWDIRWEIAANVVSMLFFFLITAAALRQKSGEEKTAGPVWMLPVLSTFVFSVAQWENWIWGVQLQMFLCVLAAGAGLFILSGPALTPFSFIASAACGFVSAWSFASGFAFWPAGLLLLLLRQIPAHARAAVSLLWILLAAVSLAVYLHGYVQPNWHPAPVNPLENPGAFWSYLTACLGSPFVARKTFHDLQTAIFLGRAGLAALFFFAAFIRRVPTPGFRFFFSLAVFGFLTAAVTAYGRAGFSPYQGLAPRYVTTTITFWAGLAGMSGWAAERLRLKGRIPAFSGGLLYAAWLVLTPLAVRASWNSSPLLIERSREVREASAALDDLTDDTQLKKLFADPDRLKPWAKILKEKNLTIYRKGRSGLSAPAS